MINKNVFDRFNKTIAIRTISFVLFTLFSSIAVKVIRLFIVFDCPKYWPVSVFRFRMPNWNQLLLCIAIVVLFYFITKNLSRILSRISRLILIGIILVLGTNLVQGWDNGFVKPIAGEGQYYQDAINIKDAFHFYNNFEQLQYDLFPHSRTHPPGATLLIYFLSTILKKPEYISIILAIFSISLSIFFLHGLLLNEFSEGIAMYITFLFILLPPIQIYYCASIDAIISSLLLGVLYFFTKRTGFINVTSCIIFLFLSSFLTFGSIFILPVLFAYQFFMKKNILKPLLILFAVTFIYGGLTLFIGFNYITVFFNAMAIENMHRFNLASYFFTRIENIYEIVLFFGPFLTIIFLSTIYTIKLAKTGLGILTLSGIITLLTMFLMGAFRTGETARICIFIYPYLLFSIAFYLQEIRPALQHKAQLATLVFSQTLIMQLFGWYFW